MRIRFTFALALLAGAVACDDTPTSFEENGDPTPGTLTLEKIGGYNGGAVGAAEITAFDPASKHLFVVNGALGTVDVLDIANPAMPTLVSTINLSQFGSGANSVAIHDGVAAIAIEAAVKTSPGTVAFYNAASLQLISSVAVGSLPDMVTFTPNGNHVLVANEGEPNDAYTIDPEGSVSIIDVRNMAVPTVRTAGFASFNARVDALRASGVRIYGPNATVAQDLEP